jgi:hypothetical protein
MIECRGSFVKNTICSLGFKTYLEIGLSHNPKAPYRLITDNSIYKTSIDYDKTTKPDYCMSSDEFFNKLRLEKTDFNEKHKWDCIFIDGDHFAEQVYLDLNNAFKHLSDNGVIFMHDSLPWLYDMTIEEKVWSREATCQDAWKVIEFCLKERGDMHVCTIEENGGGIGVITKCSSPRPMLPREFNRFYQFGVYNRDKFKFMNTIKSDNLLKWIKSPTYNF